MTESDFFYFSTFPGPIRLISPGARLWFGKDHLLSIEKTHWTENYKRFHYRDIQGIFIQRNNRRAIINAILIALGFLGLLLVLSFNSDSAVQDILIMSTFAALPATVLVLINSDLGPGCTCYIKTAAQFEKLDAIARLGTANRLLEQLRPRILEAQGSLSDLRERLPEIVDAPAAEGSQQPSPGYKMASMAAPLTTMPAAVHPPGRAHLLLFGLTLANAVLDVVILKYHPYQVLLFNLILFIVMMIVMTFAIYRQLKFPTVPQVAWSTWGIVMLQGLTLYLATIVNAIWGASGRVYADNMFDRLRQLAEFSPLDDGPRFALLVLELVGCTVLGLTGLMGCFPQAKVSVAPPPLPPPPAATVLPAGNPESTSRQEIE